LKLGSDWFSGYLPVQLGQFKHLEYLNLEWNSFLDPIPASLGRLSSLIQLSLGLNHLNGSIPKSFGQLSNLEVLNVSDNKLGGMVSELHFANLRHLTGTDIVFKFFCYRFRPTWVPPFQLQGIGMSISVSTMASKFKHKRMLEFYKCLMQVYWFEEISSGIFWLNLSHDHIRKCLPKLLLVGTYIWMATNLRDH
jgi:hypothetical protein